MFGGKSVLEAFPQQLGTEHRGPSDISEHPEKYLHGFGDTKNLRRLLQDFGRYQLPHRYDPGI